MREMGVMLKLQRGRVRVTTLPSRQGRAIFWVISVLGCESLRTDQLSHGRGTTTAAHMAAVAGTKNFTTGQALGSSTPLTVFEQMMEGIEKQQGIVWLFAGEHYLSQVSQKTKIKLTLCNLENRKVYRRQFALITKHIRTLKDKFPEWPPRETWSFFYTRLREMMEALEKIQCEEVKQSPITDTEPDTKSGSGEDGQQSPVKDVKKAPKSDSGIYEVTIDIFAEIYESWSLLESVSAIFAGVIKKLYLEEIKKVHLED